MDEDERLGTIDVYLGASIDQILANLPVGSIDRAISNSLYGFNARHKNAPLPRAKDSYGYTFFTRPQLNLTDNNLSNQRRMYSMLSSQPLSYQRYVRMMLDPRLKKYGMDSPFVNNENPFIPLLSNSITSLSGFPDLAAPNYTSEAGLYGQEISWTDGVMNQFESYEISCTFRNTKGSPVLYMMMVWLFYQTYVMEATMNPYMDLMMENEIDYNTRIYRLVTDERNQYVTHIAATGASYPINLPTASFFDYSVEKPYLDGIGDLNIRFKAMGFMFNEDILKLEFNQTSAIFNPSIARLLNYDMMSTDIDKIRRDDLQTVYSHREAGLTKVPHHLLQLEESSYLDNNFYNLSYNMIPYINLATNELEWWVSTDRYKGS